MTCGICGSKVEDTGEIRTDDSGRRWKKYKCVKCGATKEVED